MNIPRDFGVWFYIVLFVEYLFAVRVDFDRIDGLGLQSACRICIFLFVSCFFDTPPPIEEVN